MHRRASLNWRSWAPTAAAKPGTTWACIDIMVHQWISAAILIGCIIISCAHQFGADAFVPATSHPTHRSRSRAGAVHPLLGIKGFRSWFEGAFPSAVTTISPDDRNGRNEAEEFDHVLIDANQFLHSSLRKAHNRRVATGHTAGEQEEIDDELIDHCLLLFLRELKRITSTTAIPRRSLVIAIDGSPGAAKLGTQRRRRSSIYKKAETQGRQLEVLQERGWRENDFGFYSKKRRGFNPLFSKHERERVSLNITPGTAFMDRVTDALLYWSWQYVSKHSRVRVYLSPSCVHGEGEVKLLDWIFYGHEQPPMSPRKRRTNVKMNNETVAILGGDSDLVLMGLVVPPRITPNIHVILPGTKGKSLVVSIWETTRMITRMIEGTATYGQAKNKRRRTQGSRERTLTLSQINRVRIDMALLIIMTGNDYLPAVRSGFDIFFNVYIDLAKQWLDDHDEDPFLVTYDESNQLCFNVPFARAFFDAMGEGTLPPDKDTTASSNTQSLLGTLINLGEAKILPTPLSWRTIKPEDSFFQDELRQMNANLGQDTSQVMEEVFADGAEIIRLTLGHFPQGSEDAISTQLITSDVDGHGVISRMRRSDDETKAGGRAYLFEVPHRQQFSSKKAKYRLACLALEEMFGRDNVDALFGGGGDDDNDADSASLREKPLSVAKADPASYLGGLLWNLETYQRGCCGDYGYDYGWRHSPSTFELVDFLGTLQDRGVRKISYNGLVGRSPTAPVSDGLACLATTPPQAFEIIPKPYSWMVEPDRRDSFEELYNSCFDPETNAFNIQVFQSKCHTELAKIRSMKDGIETVDEAPEKEDVQQKESPAGRHIYAGKKSWTVLSLARYALEHPFDPPEPFSDRVRRLRRNKRIRATKQIVTWSGATTGRPAAADSTVDQPTMINGDRPVEWADLEPGESKSIHSVHDIPFKTAFK
ncbi:hypothetical protein ACHAXT_009965 [Thalassiosira profunda]